MLLRFFNAIVCSLQSVWLAWIKFYEVLIRIRFRVRHTCSEVNNEIKKEDCVGDTVEDNPARTKVIIEEGNGDGKDDEVSNEQNQHEQVPVESETQIQ